MTWTKTDHGLWSSEGYRIAAFRDGEKILYGVYAPPLDTEVFNSRLKTQYAFGEAVPQRIALLGHFTDPEAARAVAVRHKNHS